MRSPLSPSFNLILEQVDNAIALFDSSSTLTLFNSKLTQLWKISDSWLQTQPQCQQLLSELAVQGNWSLEDCQQFEQAVQATSEVVLTVRQQDNNTVEIHISSTTDAERLCIFRVSEEPPARLSERLCLDSSESVDHSSTIEAIQIEIAEKLGFVPPFFFPAQNDSQVLSTLWQQTLVFYLDNPLPVLFKEKLFAYLSRYCIVPYCMVCHSCALRLLGWQAQQILELLASPIPTEAEINQHLEFLLAQPKLSNFPESNSALEKGVLWCSVTIFLKRDQAALCYSTLRHLLRAGDYQNLITFIAYVKTCHLWMEAHPEVSYEMDKRAQDHLDVLLTEAPGLGDFFSIYTQQIQQQQHDLVQYPAAIAERRQAIAALQQSEEKFRNLVEQTSDWVWEVDLNQCFVYINPKVNQVLGYEPEELLGKTAFDLMQPDEAKRFATLINFYVTRQEPFTNLEERLLHRAGQSVVLETSGSPIFNAQGKLQGYRGISRDITARKQVEQEIRKALTRERELNELKSRFISMTSHEFRTPMSTILLSAEMLENYSQFLTEEKKQKHFRRLKTAIAHIVYLLDDVSLLGQVEGGKAKLSLELIHLEEFCRDLIEEVQGSIGAGRAIEFTCQGLSASIGLDKKLFRSVLSNLLSNALKYSSSDSTVQVRLTYQETQVVLEVQDWGIGIPPEDQPRLFESFHRAKNVINIQGTGLGLAIAKRCVALHNGQIEVESTLNVGTTFRVRLPL
ncbi:PAS domain-containing sensor histidine kinase [Leptolyngbya sp. FACHB-541]|uniref:ATP-binding protein n=1 Tax=Leptolyngbya sp. FACHB-541 TaxID=2692810 RepID=UPI0016881EEF|nr:ATP-binding protein [Leptolyngbya sp. FACHB-541]MBD2000712.1 PAS domain-containing sensor histidine kinase [Leptolyngbya sp. FACHB-541]